MPFSVASVSKPHSQSPDSTFQRSPGDSERCDTDCSTIRLSVSIETTFRTQAKPMIQSPTSPRCITPVFLTRIPPAALQSPASHKTEPCQSSTLPRQLERGEAKSSENLDNAMHSRSCAPDDPHHHINITRHVTSRHGMARRTSTARERPLTSAAVKRAFVPKRPCHSQYGSRKSDAPLKVRYSNNPSFFFFYSSPYRFGHEYGAPKVVTCLSVASYLWQIGPTQVSTRGVES